MRNTTLDLLYQKPLLPLVGPPCYTTSLCKRGGVTASASPCEHCARPLMGLQGTAIHVATTTVIVLRHVRVGKRRSEVETPKATVDL